MPLQLLGQCCNKCISICLHKVAALYIGAAGRMLHSTQIFWRCRVAALYTVDRMQSTITSAVRGHVERVVTTDTSRLPHTRKSSKRLRAQVLVLNALSLPEDVSQCIHKSCTGVPKDFAKELLLQHHGMKWCNMCGGCIIYADRCKVTACLCH